MAPADSPASRASQIAPQLPSTEALLQSLPWGVLLLAADGTVAVLNPQAEALWGLPAAAVLGRRPAEVQPALLPAELVQSLANAADDSPTTTYWLAHTRQWINMRTAPAADGLRWVYWDNVTAREQATGKAPAAPDSQEHELVQGAWHEEQERYHKLFEGMSQGFCIVEVLFDDTKQPVDYRFLVTNPAFEQQTGLGDVVGQTMRVLRPEHEDHWFELYGHIAQTGEPQRFTRIAEQLGAFYEVYAFRVGEPAEHKVAILFSDISEAQRTEAALRESEESYRTLFNSIDEGYFLCDVLFDEQAVPVDIFYRDANPAATRLMGADFRGRRLLDIDPDYEGYWIEIFGRVAQTGVGERLEQYADPNKKWYDFYISKVGDEASRRVAVVFQDTTERKQNEEALRASEAQIAADLAGMRRLYELQAKLADQNDVQAALRDVLAAACEFTGTDRGCVQLLSPDGERLEMAVWQGYPDDSPFISFFRYEGLKTGCEVTRMQRQRLIIEDTVGFEGLDGTEAGAATYADDIRAAQSTPMTSRANETIGVISTQFRQPHRPNNHELRLLDMLAWTAAEFLERHRAEAARRASEQQFRLLTDAVPQIVWVTDADGRVEFFNKQWSNYTGVPYEPTTTEAVAVNFVHPDDGAATLAAFTEALATGTTFLIEHRIRSQAGDYRWFLVRAEPYRDANTGKITRWFGASVDIHDRKQAEVALEKAHERLQLAMNTGRIFSFEINPATRALELSDNVDSVMGFPLPDHIDSTFELIHPDDLQPTVALINGAIDARGSYASEYRLVNPANGEVVWFHSQAAFTRSNASGEWRFVGIAQNITESKRAEQQLQELMVSLEEQVAERTQSLRESQELLQLVFDTSLMALSVQEAVRDASGVIQDFRVVLLNKELERELGRTDMVGKHYVQEYPGMKASGLFNLMCTTVETGEPQHMEYYYPYEGFNRWFSCTFVKLNDGVMATNLDITPRKLAEQERFKNLMLLQQSEEVARLGSWEYDLSTNAFTWSAGMYRLFDLPMDMAVTPEIYEQAVVAEDRPAAGQLVRQIRTGQGPLEATMRLQVGEQVRTIKVKGVVTHNEDEQPLKVLGVDVDITDLVRLEQENLRLRLEQQQQMFNAVLEAQEAERQRIAEGLHNGVGQILYATKLQLDQLHTTLPNSAWARATELLADAIRQTRSISHELTPRLVAELGLEAALQDICRNMTTKALHFECLVLLDEALPQPLQVGLYRLAQELTQNVAKHADATHAALEVATRPGWVVLRVEDNGRGFAPEQLSTGIGLKTLRDRVQLLNGTTHLVSSEKGTLVELRIPLPE